MSKAIDRFDEWIAHTRTGSFHDFICGEIDRLDAAISTRSEVPPHDDWRKECHRLHEVNLQLAEELRAQRAQLGDQVFQLENQIRKLGYVPIIACG